MQEVARTARWTAALRAQEHERPDRLFEDPFAQILAGPEGLAMLEHMGQDAAKSILSEEGAKTAKRLGMKDSGKPRQDPILSIRTRFFDDFLTDAVQQTQARQVVLLAAGMDARAYRIQWPQGTVLFEVDQPGLNRLKESILSDHGAVPSCQLHRLDADLRYDWEQALQQAGFDRSKASVWLVEGLVSYLDESAVNRLLHKISSLTLSGSRLGMDLVNANMLTSPMTKDIIAKLAAQGTPWHFGTNRPKDLFTGHGWKADITEFGDAKANFGRWPFPRVPKFVPKIPRGFLAVATRK